MHAPLNQWQMPLRLALMALTFWLTLAIRIRGIDSHFALLFDQIRDWDLALKPFRELPLVGPATHVGGYTIGPAFYWILWTIRVVVGPWFDNLPHAGGVGQAILLSGTDVLFLCAVWRVTRSVWVALASIVLLSTASFDLNLAAVIWNPVVGSALARMVTAVILFEWHRKSAFHVALTAALAVAAVHAYTGAVFVAVSVLAVLVVEPFTRGSAHEGRRNIWVVALAILCLQVPYIIYQLQHRFDSSAMGAVTGSVARILTGQEPPRVSASIAGYVRAFEGIQVQPVSFSFSAWVLVCCAVAVVLRHFRNPVLLAVTILPQALAIVGYAFFLSGLDNYYYLSLMPAAVLMVLLGVTAFVPERLQAIMGAVLLAATLSLVPQRLALAAALPKLPEYGTLVRASRQMAHRGTPLRSIRTEFELPPSTDPRFMYLILGGHIDRNSPWVALITADGRVTYQHIE